MKIIVCTRDLDFGVGSCIKSSLKEYDKDITIKKVLVIGPKKLKGYTNKIHFKILPTKGKYFITKEPFFAFQCNKKIKNIIKKESFNQIELHFPIYAEDFGVKLISKFHGLHKSIIKSHPKTFQFLIASFFHKIYSYFDYKTIKYSNKVYFVSKRTLEEAKKFYPEFKHKLYHKPNEIDKSKFFKLNKKEKPKIKKELGLADGRKNILYIGRLDPLKGILDLIAVIKDINNSSLRLIIIGGGPLKNKIQKYSFVKYLERIPNEELYKYYNVADLFVLPSYYENCPMTILEAKACDCKILASNVGDNEFVLKKNQIFEKGDKIELEEKIRRILK